MKCEPERTLRYDQLMGLLRRFHLGGRLLELGAGPGGLRSWGFGGETLSVDLVAFDGLAVQADGRRLPFPDGAFTTAVCVDVLEHLAAPARGALVAELRRVTSDLLIIAAPMGPGAEACDGRLLRWFRRASVQAPEWLDEHVAAGRFPTQREVEEMVGLAPIETTRGVTLPVHQLLTAFAAVRGGTRVGRWACATPRRRAVLARVGCAGSRPYRSAMVFRLRPLRFSVIMATRDRANLLPDAVASVLAQTEREFELLIVDDGSRDATPEVTRLLAKEDPRIRLVRLNTPTGSAALARNAALPFVAGDALAFCDDDVRWHPGHLAACSDALQRAPACYTQAARFLPDGRLHDVVGTAWAAEGPEAGQVDTNVMAVRRHTMLPFPDGRGRYECEDILLAKSLVRRGVRFEFVPRVTVDYRFNPASHCYRYSIEKQGERTVVVSRPRVDDWPALRNRVVEALGTRVRAVGLRTTSGQWWWRWPAKALRSRWTSALPTDRVARSTER